MKIATWNVNSIRARKDRVLAWLERTRPDAVCLQELKGEENVFPLEEIEAAGYRAAVCGQKTYNGVAILVRNGIADIERNMDDGVDDPQARFSIRHINMITHIANTISISGCIVPVIKIIIGADRHQVSRYAYTVAKYAPIVMI